MDWICKGFFHQSSTPRMTRPFWSLQKMLDHLASFSFLLSALPEQKFEKAVFLLALPPGWGCHRFMPSPDMRLGWFSQLTGSRFLWLHIQNFWSKMNARSSCSSFVILAWIKERQPHSLCSVSDLHLNRKATPQAPWDHLSVWTTSLALCSRWHIAQVLCQATDAADPGKGPALRDVHKVGILCDFLCFYPEDITRRKGQCSSS